MVPDPVDAGVFTGGTTGVCGREVGAAGLDAVGPPDRVRAGPADLLRENPPASRPDIPSASAPSTSRACPWLLRRGRVEDARADLRVIGCSSVARRCPGTGHKSRMQIGSCARGVCKTSASFLGTRDAASAAAFLAIPRGLRADVGFEERAACAAGAAGLGDAGSAADRRADVRPLDVAACEGVNSPFADRPRLDPLAPFRADGREDADFAVSSADSFSAVRDI